MPEIRILETLREIAPQAWNHCFPGEVEDYHYLLATEEAGIQGFSWCYVTAWADGTLLAAIPAFLTDYHLDATLQGTGKKITNAITSAFPTLLTMKLACLGSPCTEKGLLGLHPELAEGDVTELLTRMVQAFEAYADSKQCRIVGIKDVPDSCRNLWDACLHPLRYGALQSLPTAALPIDFVSIDDYLARLSHRTRKDMRRKMKAFSSVTVEKCHDLTGVLPQVMALYHDTRDRSEWQFEELTEAYFQNVLTMMPQGSFCNLYYAGEELLAANLLVHDSHTLIDKFFCMNGTRGREHNLYFLSWFTNLRYCLDHGLTCYQSGQAYYENKVRLGSTLSGNWMYFRHRNSFTHGLLKCVAPLLAVNETEKLAA